MALSPAASKGLLALAGAGAAGGGLAGGIHLLKSTPTIQDQLKSLELISSLDPSKVDAQWNEEFTLDSERIKAAIPSVNSGQELKNWCSDSLKKESKGNDDLIVQVKKWCTIGTIEERLSRKKGKAFIVDTEDTEWEKIYNNNTTGSDRKAIGLDENKDDSAKKDSDKKAIKAFCTKEKGNKFLAETKTTSADRVEKWCMKSSS
ncbi:hypothetical protein MHF_1358 [Mycoplasma haemofelis Ohio2]|uniref:Uncharacterized protein n=1 Tax=Mycoplasma haemofelis (strain Ohio2) TaxID=859194 RepID=F6FG96_MYCHI|nr:hypothetical protein MHF_1358 [Mycoplasma haemofelis Ohio2]